MTTLENYQYYTSKAMIAAAEGDYEAVQEWQAKADKAMQDIVTHQLCRVKIDGLEFAGNDQYHICAPLETVEKELNVDAGYIRLENLFNETENLLAEYFNNDEISPVEVITNIKSQISKYRKGKQ